jgi:hypothetical protein
MNVLWFAFGIYILGIAIVLILRPSLMFHTETGTWKEFGVGRSIGNYTIFPIWMFVFLWAIVSYALASFISIFLSGLAMQSMNKNVSTTSNNLIKPISAAAAATTPGYYVLESPPIPTANPKYVYYGPNPPSIENLGRI